MPLNRESDASALATNAHHFNTAALVCKLLLLTGGRGYEGVLEVRNFEKADLFDHLNYWPSEGYEWHYTRRYSGVPAAAMDVHVGSLRNR
jgi:hypothetical protein